MGTFILGVVVGMVISAFLCLTLDADRAERELED